MFLTEEEQALLSGAQGPANQKAMQILAALGTIYGAERMVPIASAQIAGVSYDNLGEAGLEWLTEMAEGGGQARVTTTLNPAGSDADNWPALGISSEFAANQQRVLDAFRRMGVIDTCTCTPYLIGNLPRYGQHVAWAESSAVCYTNAVLGARTNREGGPSALAAALTGRTPAYGYHLDDARRPSLTVQVQARLDGPHHYGALGKVIGEQLEARRSRVVTYIQGAPEAGVEELKALCASLATYGGAAMFHLEGVTPEAALHTPPDEGFTVTQADLEMALAALSDARPEQVDFISLGCPHLTIQEIARLAARLQGRQVQREFWITTARATKTIADRMGYTAIIEASGAKFAADTCCVVAPIRGRFTALATDSAKACYYAYAKNKFHTWYGSFEDVAALALK